MGDAVSGRKMVKERFAEIRETGSYRVHIVHGSCRFFQGKIVGKREKSVGSMQRKSVYLL